ncbi:MAG: Flp pilus assembly protein CpaB [Lentisphaeria bacterium]|jgi:Flp pilus assembly protein CpaB
MKEKLPLVVAIILGLFGIIVVNKYIRVKTTKPDVPMVKVLAAARRVEIGAALVLEDVTAADGSSVFMIEIPETALTRDHIRLPDGDGPNEVQQRNDMRLMMVGRKVRRSIDRGSPLFWTHFEEDSLSTLSARISRERRAVTVGVDALSAVGYNIVPGDRVDLLVTLQPQLMATMQGGRQATDMEAREIRRQRGGYAEPVTTFLMQDVRVLATGTNYGGGIQQQRGNSSYNSITLDVLPREAVLLTHARRQGSISFLLRSPVSDERLQSDELESCSIRDSEIHKQVGALDEVRAQTFRVLGGKQGGDQEKIIIQER